MLNPNLHFISYILVIVTTILVVLSIIFLKVLPNSLPKTYIVCDHSVAGENMYLDAMKTPMKKYTKKAHEVIPAR